MSAAKIEDKDASAIQEESSVVTSFPPSHILQDGRFIFLPPPNQFERSKCFERAIAKYGLLESDMAKTGKEQHLEQEDEAEDEKKEDDKDKTAPKVHPLAAASARLQGNGISELNRAINLSTLVNTGEYFGLSNIVDPSLELIGSSAAKGGATAATPATAGAASGAAAGGSAGPMTSGTAKGGDATAAVTPTAGGAASVPSTQAQKELQEELRVKSAYVLKRKRAVFEKASRVLKRHQLRLEAATKAQRIPDQRLRELRSQWRLVAPEHGTRAKPHAVRPTEVVAVDVDVYDPTGGGTGTSSLVGRLASQVPRYATVELTDDYCHRLDQTKTQKAAARAEVKEEANENDDMEIDSPNKQEKKSVTKNGETADDGQETRKEKGKNQYSGWTMAEPFAVVDPTLGKISADFDPNKVSCLTLQFDIEKPSTGFCMSSCLEPMTTTTIEKMKEEKSSVKIKQEPGVEDNDSNKIKKESGAETNEKDKAEDVPKQDNENAKDEQVLVSLQHSLFCAKLFAAIRQELMGEETGDENMPAQQRQQQQKHGQTQTQPAHHSVVWLASESEENFLPPPSVMVRPTGDSTGAALCVVHCHASEVKVQLDTEYTLRAKLVEANDQNLNGALSGNNNDSIKNKIKSGSQTPEQILVLCRSLLLHAQEAYHKHSLQESFAAAQKQREEEEKKLRADFLKPKGLDRIQKKDARKQPKILQNVVGLGTKMLFEQRIRKVLVVRLFCSLPLVSLYPAKPTIANLLNLNLHYNFTYLLLTESPTLA